MEAFLLYQVKVAVLLAVFYLGYRLLLGRETFHRFNRIVLITIALISFVLPFFHITRYIDKPLPATRIESIESQSIGNDNAIQLSIPSGETWSSQTPADELVSQQTTNTATPAAVSNPQPARRSIEDLLVLALFVIYWVGFLWVIVRKIISVSSMARIIKTGRYANRLEGCDVIESDQIPQPLNWMRFIVMPREWFEHENALIWKHENLHASRWHSLDLLMADVMTALQWFNPVIILLHKEFELIHEYEADQAVIESGADDTEYKLMLVDAVASSRGMVMTNWLKQSNLKKRIDMMDKFQSNGWNRLRALFILNYFTHYRNLKMLLSNINDKNLFGGDSPLSFTMDQRAEFLRKLSIKEQDLDKLIKAQAYIIIYNKRFIYIAEPETSRIDMSLPLGSMGGVSAPTDPYEYLKNNPNISVDEEGNWYAYGKKAVIWEIEQPAGEKMGSLSGMSMGVSRPLGSMTVQPMGGSTGRPMGGSQSMSNLQGQ